MIDFLTIVLLVFGVLQIVLFFKIWGMTNDIREMRNKYLKDVFITIEQPKLIRNIRV